MNTDVRSLFVRHALLLLLICLPLGWLTEAYSTFLAIGLFIYVLWLVRHLIRLQQWLLKAEDGVEPPEASGFWGELFDTLYYAQRRERQKREGLEAVIDRALASTAALRDGVVLVDRHGNLEWWNPAAEGLLGLRSPQDNGQPIANLVRHPRFSEYFSRGIYQDPLELTSPLNDRQYLHVQITRFGEGDRLILVRDVTRLHQLEQMRKDFVANVSHELRTPLTVIAGYVETLVDNADQDANPRWLRALGQMQQQANRMQHLIDDLLLLAKLEATDYPADNKPIAIAPMLHVIQQDARALSAQRGHKITLEADSTLALKGSEPELRSAFSNLVFNAVKYTPDGGQIRIRWWQDERGAQLSVSDSGLGIEARHLPRLTERFYRVDASRASSTGGTGLGLAIVKHVLIRHHGHLEIESTPGQGSVFTCVFQSSQIAHLNDKDISLQQL
ncbi:two-component system phosphate regulon sensor histidine kinase PhoR [Pseudomonas duriflava]|uniref:Phosphate regulon sensor protein PhoR n=1 Tax=Pseudomonas duriflava TaxID=459528 RepID=A0A562PZ01_9PSED|nr:phosphate regulon sensor histidine kinase PhoR [Pseudomonas duriflava]TWI49316.1 two-component system phosphate regulon sensor histidine kinase PhoR [Pseudomonas duriflava]